MVSRAFDSFDCSTDDCTALIVSSRKPVKRLSIPFRFFRLLSPKTTSATAPNQNCAKHHRGSFDSFDCHFITFGALFQPFVIGITPSKRAVCVRLHPFCPWDGTPVEWVERGHSTDILLILFKKHTQSNESNEVCMSFRYWDRGGRLVADRRVTSVSIMVLRLSSTKEAPQPSPCIPHPPPLERSYGGGKAELWRR